MLIYAFVALVIVICLILYKFFSVVETLVDEHSSKKENFSNFNEVNNNVKTLIQNRGSTPSSFPKPHVLKLSKNHKSFNTDDNLVQNERLITKLKCPNTVSIPANKVEAVVNVGKDYERSIGLDNGKYTFPIGKFMYDGIWNRKIVNVKNVYQGNDWSIPKNKQLDGSYSTKKFFHNPELNFVPGEYVVENNCYENTDYMDCCN
jgi:hypothetical protein